MIDKMTADGTFAKVQEIYLERDAMDGMQSFSVNDWDRTKIAFELFFTARTIIDIGIGQGQLVSLFCEAPHVIDVIAIDRKKHSKLIEPRSKKYKYYEFDITEPFPNDLPKSDITIAMEVFEHIDVNKLKKVVESAKNSSKRRMLFASVPFKEKHPLYHHNKPYGHKQSFDETVLVENFGPKTIWTNFRNRWYLIFSADNIEHPGEKSLEDFLGSASYLFQTSSAHY